MFDSADLATVKRLRGAGLPEAEIIRKEIRQAAAGAAGSSADQASA